MNAPIAQAHYEMGCAAGRRGPEPDEDPQCAHIFGCADVGTVMCDCSEWICPAHTTRCPECGLQVCASCSFESVDDQVRRCYACTQDTKCPGTIREVEAA